MNPRNNGELGENLIAIMRRLMANDNLVNLLFYTDDDPLNNPPLTESEKRLGIYEKLIKVVPRVGPKEDAKSVIAIRVERARGLQENSEFKEIVIKVDVIVPLTQWIIKDTNLRPFLILGEIQNSLHNKVIKGLGKMEGGDFDLNFLTDEVCCYEQTFLISTYD